MNIEKFLQNINSKDYLNVVLRSHLFIEAKIVEILHEKLVNPNALEFNKLNFPLKLQLCASLGILEKQDLPAYIRLNKLRNDSAHRLDFEIADKNIQELISLLNPEQLKIANINEDDDLAFQFRKCITALYLILADIKGEFILRREK